jgi:hypothetical protein
MNEIKTLVDQMRSRIKDSAVPGDAGDKAKKDKTVAAREVSPKSNAPPVIPAILEAIRAYDNSKHKSLVHARFDSKTVQTLNQLKLAAGIDTTRLVAFAVDRLLQQHPELKTIIKQFFQKLDE